MTLHFTTTAELAQLHGVKCTVHARAGMGKTTLVHTLHEHPTTGPALMLSCESGALSLGHVAIPAINIHSLAEMDEAYNFIALSQHAAGFKSIALDSISEIAEVCLGAEKALTKDGRRAYGEMADKMAGLIRKFRDLPGRHVYFSAKQGYVKDEITGISKYGPDMPGQRLVQEMPYFFDEVFSLEIGRTQDGKNFRYLRTQTDIQFECKDRSGKLDPFEEPHLGKVIDKILSVAKSK